MASGKINNTFTLDEIAVSAKKTVLNLHFININNNFNELVKKNF